jgi:hypothetical protein
MHSSVGASLLAKKTTRSWMTARPPAKRQQLAQPPKEFPMKSNSDQTQHNPDEPALPGEVERDNDALRPNDPAKREQQGNAETQESDAQKTARRD